MRKQILVSRMALELESSPDLCAHSQIREIGQDFDEQGKMLRLIRCQSCGLLMREYLRIL